MHATRTILIVLLLGAVVLGQAVEVHFTVKSAGNVSVGVFDARGHLLRTLQSGKKTAPGTYTLTWDGTDERGEACPPGAYAVRGISSKISATLQLVAGSPGQPPYFTADGKGGWNGHWGNPLAVACDASGVYLDFAGEEGAGSQLKLDFLGHVQWKAHIFQGDGNGTQLASVSDGTHLYIRQPQGMLFATDDGGNTWRNVNPVRSSLTGLFLLDAHHGWAVGGRGGGVEVPAMILYYTDEEE